MVYPEERSHRLKYHFWRVYTPFHPYVRDLALALKVVKHKGRGNFLMGRVAPHSSIETLVSHLVSSGFGYHKVAWEDESEVVGLRRVENFLYQYHIRIYDDGEIRAHYERTPEAYPLLHMSADGQEERREEFLELLEDHIIEHTPDDRA